MIFIMTDDPFGYDRMMYTVRRMCVEEPEIPYDDGELTYYLYAYGTKNIPSQELKDMLKFLVDSSKENAKNDRLVQVRTMMDRIQYSREVEIKYMHTYSREMYIRKEGYDSGYDARILSQIQKKLERGKTIQQIADEVEESVETVKRIMQEHQLN